MSVLWIVLPASLAIAAGFLWACLRAIRSGQFDDMDTPAVRALFDDEPLTRD